MAKQYCPAFEDMINMMSHKNKKEYELLDWKAISSFKYLSVHFLRNFSHKLNWNIISTFQMLTFDELKEFRRFLNWKAIKNTHIARTDPNFYQEFKNELAEHLWDRQEIRLEDNTVWNIMVPKRKCVFD